jgi:hypothetical protein
VGFTKTTTETSAASRAKAGARRSQIHGDDIMKIIEGWNGQRTLWIVQERRAAGREKETAFTTEGNAKVYRDLVRAARRTADPMRLAKLTDKLERMRAHAFVTIG